MSGRRRDPQAAREAARYEQPIASRQFIMDELRRAGEPLSFPQLRDAVATGTPNETEALRRRLRAMCRDGQLMIDRRGRYALVEKLDLVRGRVRMQRSGHAFLALPGDELGAFIHERQTRRLIDGDVVLARLHPREPGEEPEAVVVEVLERSDAPIVGRFHSESGISFVEPENHRLNQDIVVPPDGRGDAVSGDYVKVVLSVPPDLHHPPVGQVVEVIGNADTAGVEAEIVLEAFGIPQRFSRDALAEANRFGGQIAPSETRARVDLRGLPLVTIDGADAKDFDDAVYCERRPKGGFRLVVAIADVAHYVPVSSALDECALERGTSVYLPDRVVPMLPETLSNDLCSLRPHVDRLCMVCDLRISARGRISRYVFYEGVMRSAARLTYDAVESFLRPESGSDVAACLDPTGAAVPDAVTESLRNLDALYRALREQREARGALDFESRETRIQVSERGHIDAIVPVPRRASNELIEECMIAANVASARFLERQKPGGLFRVHERPKANKVAELRSVLDALGIRLVASDAEMTPAVMQSILEQLRRRPGGSVFESLVLRVLTQAHYTPKNVGHFGLALPAYTHFTSPIRRYPDLLVHRAIKAVIHSRQRSDLVLRPRGTQRVSREAIYPYDADDLRSLGEQTSMTERRAEDAVRDLEAWLKCEYMTDHLGDTFDGKIAAVTPFGLFVELDRIFIQGLVHVTALGGDYYHYDQPSQRLIGENTGLAFRLGQPLEVTVARVDVAERQIDLVPAKPILADSTGRGRHRRPRTPKRPRYRRGRRR